MKSLTILRHAKSGWDAPVERDFDRPINTRGRRGAQIIGEYWHRAGWPVDWIIASPAVRVIDTLDIFQPAAGIEQIEPHWDRRIYLASAATLLDVVRDLGDIGDDVLIVGHNPGLEDLILMLVPDDGTNALRDAAEEKLPTAAFARLEIDIAHWSELRENGGRLTQFVRPRDLDPDLGPTDD